MTVLSNLQHRVDPWITRLAQGLAGFGGIVLLGMAVVTCVSVVGRWINTGPIRAISGDYELIEAGCAIAVFAFLPYCQLNRGHVTVDILADRFPKAVRKTLTVVGNVLITAVAFVVMWRLYIGWGEKFPYLNQNWRDTLSMGYKPFFPETTYELQIPIWIPMGLALIGSAMFFVVSLYTVWRSFNEVAK